MSLDRLDTYNNRLWLWYKTRSLYGLLSYFSPYGLLGFPQDNGIAIVFIVGKDMALYYAGVATIVFGRTQSICSNMDISTIKQ